MLDFIQLEDKKWEDGIQKKQTMETASLNIENYFAIAAGVFFFVYGAVVLYRGQIMSDASNRFEGKIIVGFRAKLMGFIVMILGISVVGFGLVAI